MENKSPSATNTHDKAEKVKRNMHGYAAKSKETIHQLIESSIRLMQESEAGSAKVLESLKRNSSTGGSKKEAAAGHQPDLDKSAKLAGDTVNTIVNSYTRQMELTVDFNTKLVDLVKESNPDNADKFLDLINANFERTRSSTADNTKEILALFNKHSNLALHFNEKFATTVNSQLDSLFQTQKTSLDRFTHWAAEWWKE